MKKLYLITIILLLFSVKTSYSQQCDDYWVSPLQVNGRESKPVIDNNGFLYQVGRNRNGANVQGITIAKYSQNGNLSWSQEIAGDFASFRLRVAVFNDNLYVGGSYRSADFDGNGLVFSTENDLDPFILKMDTTGFVVSVQKFPGNGSDNFLGLTNDSEGNLYFTGRFRQHLVLPNTDTLGLTASTNFLIPGLL